MSDKQRRLTTAAQLEECNCQKCDAEGVAGWRQRYMVRRLGENGTVSNETRILCNECREASVQWHKSRANIAGWVNL